MAQSFKEIVQNNEDIMQLLRLIDKKAIGENGEIRIGDFEGTCAKITTINTKNPREYTRRIAWTLTGRLLLGLTTYHDIQVQLCLEESLQLMNKCNTGLFQTQKLKTTKRKTKQVITKTKKKKTQTTEVEEEVTESESIRFWEHPLVLDKNDISTVPDMTLVPASKVTLREIDEPTVPRFVGIDDSFENNFGEDGVAMFEDEDMEMEPFVELAPNDSMTIDMGRPPIDLDENMNNVGVPEIDQVSFSSQSELAALAQKPSEVRQNENPLNLLATASPLVPPAVKASRKSGGRRRLTIVKDEDTIIPDHLMKKRTSNAFISCKTRTSTLISLDKQLKLKEVDIFSTPVMNGSINRIWFARVAKIRQADTDWATIQDAFDSGEHDASNRSSEIDILQNESENRIQTRSSSRMTRVSDSVPNEPVLTSTPNRELSSHQSAFSFHAPRSQSNFSVLDPPPKFQDSAISPPRNFQNTDQSHFVPNGLNQSFPHLNEVNVPEIDLYESPPIEHQDLATMLGENSLEYATMQKLMKLWRKNIKPINVEHLLTPRCNRFHAAKTFASLLNLKKKNLVQLDNSADGKIAHISAGDGFASVTD